MARKAREQIDLPTDLNEVVLQLLGAQDTLDGNTTISSEGVEVLSEQIPKSILEAIKASNLKGKLETDPSFRHELEVLLDQVNETKGLAENIKKFQDWAGDALTKAGVKFSHHSLFGYQVNINGEGIPLEIDVEEVGDQKRFFQLVLDRIHFSEKLPSTDTLDQGLLSSDIIKIFGITDLPEGAIATFRSGFEYPILIEDADGKTRAFNEYSAY